MYLFKGNKAFRMADAVSGGFIRRYELRVGNELVSDSQDFVYEMNLVKHTYTDMVNTKQIGVITPSNIVDVRDDEICGIYMSVSAYPSGFTITIEYDIVIPLRFINLLARLRYLPTFFGDWDLTVVPTIDNMVFSYRPIPEDAKWDELFDNYQMFGGNEWFSYGGYNPAAQPQAQFIPTNYVIKTIFLHTPQWVFRPNIYNELVIDYSRNPLRIPYSRCVSTSSAFSTQPGAMTNVRQQANRIDSVFITFHTSAFGSAVPKQPFLNNVQIRCEGSGMQLYPNSGETLNTYECLLQHSWYLDAFNMQGNIIVAPNRDAMTSMHPFVTIYIASDADNRMVVSRRYLQRGSCSDFILAIPLAPDGTFNEGVARLSHDINWEIWSDGPEENLPTVTSQLYDTMLNPHNVNRIVFTSVCDWTCILSASTMSIDGQVRVTQEVLNR
jgi:hypothetical protein